MSKFRAEILLILICFLIAPMTVLGKSSAVSSIDISDLSAGIVEINYKTTDPSKIKVRISKGKEHHTYQLAANNRFPLHLGDGEYTIMILEHFKDNKYKLVETKTVTVKLEDKNAPYLQSIQLIHWDDDMEAIAKAAELTNDLKKDQEKIAAIYHYIINHIAYDNDKAKNVKPGYIPSIDTVFEDQKGICYDYAALFAAMLRSQGIPTKLVMGNKDDIESLHAWNEVYTKDTDEWVIIDTTYDAAFIQSSTVPSMAKKETSYTSTNQY